MSLYNILFGRNAQTSLLLAVIGFKENDVQRLRDIDVEAEGKTIAIYTRTGGGNREDYPQTLLTSSPLYVRDEDDEFDSTYATFYFRVPDEFVQDVRNLSAPLEHGIRPAFAQHIAKTLEREPSEADKEHTAYETEAATLARTEHLKANGHTFVPKNDAAMEIALKLAEANQGKLRSFWGILPLSITVKRNFHQWPTARDQSERETMTRIEVDYEWNIDLAYWEHCLKRFASIYPLSMAEISEAVCSYVAKGKAA